MVLDILDFRPAEDRKPFLLFKKREAKLLDILFTVFMVVSSILLFNYVLGTSINLAITVSILDVLNILWQTILLFFQFDSLTFQK